MSETRHQRANQSFYALTYLLMNSGRAGKRMSPSHAAAKGIVKSEIIPTIAAAFETDPELDEREVLEKCESALVEILRQVMER